MSGMCVLEVLCVRWYDVALDVCDSVCGKCLCFFFFKQKTAYEMRISDWSSDVCSSDLQRDMVEPQRRKQRGKRRALGGQQRQRHIVVAAALRGGREIGRASCRERVCQYV